MCHLVRATLSGITPSPEVIAGGVWVDAVHSVVAFGLATTDHHRGGVGTVDGAVAVVWGVFGLRDLTSGAVLPPQHDRRRDRLARAMLRCGRAATACWPGPGCRAEGCDAVIVAA